MQRCKGLCKGLCKDAKGLRGVIRMLLGGVRERGSDQLIGAVNNDYIEEPTFVLGF